MIEGVQALCPGKGREQSRDSETLGITWTSKLLTESLALTQILLKTDENDEFCHPKVCKTNTHDTSWG